MPTLAFGFTLVQHVSAHALFCFKLRLGKFIAFLIGFQSTLVVVALDLHVLLVADHLGLIGCAEFVSGIGLVVQLLGASAINDPVCLECIGVLGNVSSICRSHAGAVIGIDLVSNALTICLVCHGVDLCTQLSLEPTLSLLLALFNLLGVVG